MRGSAFPDMPFNQQISFPCELTLRSTQEGPRLFREPIAGIRLLHGKGAKWMDRKLSPGDSLDLASSGDLFHIRAEVEIHEGAKLTFELRGVPVVLTARTVESGTSPAAVQSAVRSVEILLDRGSVETFINRGEISSTRFVFPKGQGLKVTVEGATVTIRSLSVYTLRSAWPKAARR